MDPDNLTLRELVKSYADQTMCFPDDDDSEFVLSLHDGLSDEQLATLQEAWPFTIPLEYLDLLRFSSGFENSPLESFDFDVNPESDFQELIPCGIRIATDGFGNDWVLELRRDTESIGPVWYRCHDAPVFLFQSNALSEFIIETFKMCMDDGQSLVNVVHEEKVCDVWENDPGLLRVADCKDSTDPMLRDFAASLDDDLYIRDLRNAALGDGFSWGKAIDFTIYRHDERPIYAFRRKRSLLDRILKRNL